MFKNLLQRFLQAVKDSIADKHDPMSIKRFDVADRLSALANMLGIKLVDPSEKYPKDWPVRDSSYGFYLSKQDNVLGSQISDSTKWQNMGTGGGGGDRNIDGGVPSSVYLPSQNYDGGTP